MNIIIKIIISISLLLLMSTNTCALSENYIIVGHIYKPHLSDHVTVRNQVTNEELTVQIIDCDHNLKEYLFDLANLKDGWNNGDRLWLFYGNESRLFTIEVIADNSMAGIQADFNRPTNIEPIVIIAGTILILASGGYYYIKRKRKEEEVITMVELTDTGKETVTVAERVAVITIFGALSLFCAYKGNFEAASGFASTIAVYFLSRQGT